MKTLEKRQCFLMSLCQWDRSGGHSCTWICFNIYISITYFIWYTARYTMRRTHVPPNVTRSAKLRDAQRSKLAFRDTDFRVQVNLIFPALLIRCNNTYCLYVLVMSRTRSRVNPHSIVAWIVGTVLLPLGPLWIINFGLSD